MNKKNFPRRKHTHVWKTSISLRVYKYTHAHTKKIPPPYSFCWWWSQSGRILTYTLMLKSSQPDTPAKITILCLDIYLASELSRGYFITPSEIFIYLWRCVSKIINVSLLVSQYNRVWSYKWQFPVVDARSGAFFFLLEPERNCDLYNRYAK